MSVGEMRLQNVEKGKCVFHHIVMATDLSAAAKPALCWAAALAHLNSCNLTVVHVSHPDWRYEVVEPPETAFEKTDVEQRLNAVVDSLHSQRQIARIVRQSTSVVQAVLAVIAESAADLLVIGTHGRGGLSKLALGSVAEELLRSASCPILTIGPKAAVFEPDKPIFRKLLFATDFGAGSTKALPLVLQLVRAQQAKLVVVHMIPPIPASSSVASGYAPVVPAVEEVREWETSTTQQERRELQEWTAANGTLDCKAEYVVGTGFLGEGISAAATKYGAQLIVMGTNRSQSPRLSAHLPWTAAHQIIHDAHCPVLTVAA